MLVQKPGSTWVTGDTYVYDAFGILISSTGGTGNSYRYAGEYWDSDLGFYYLRARYYNPSDGRFITMDTFEGNQNDPLSLHKYLYCHANPVNGTDPSGLEFNLVSLGKTFAIQGSLGALVSGGINFAIHRDGRKAAVAAAWGFGIGGVGGTGIAYLRSFYLSRSLAAEAAVGAGAGAGTGAIAIAEGDTVIGIVLNGRVVPQSVMIAGAPHSAAATAAGVLTQTGTLVEGAAAFTASKAGGEIVVMGSGTFGGTLAVAEKTIAAVRAFFH